MTGWHVTGPPGSKAPAGGVQSLSGLSASAAVADGGLVLPAASRGRQIPNYDDYRIDQLKAGTPEAAAA